MPTPSQIIEHFFPNLAQSGSYRITSPETHEYNCIAWAAGVSDTWWWPEPDSFWPLGLPRTNTVENFLTAFSRLGYELCDSFEFEARYQKLAIYLDPAGRPKHMARQLPTGQWTSKLGPMVDIEHDALSDLEGQEYGTALIFLRKGL